MTYEITFPAAQPMVDAERRERLPPQDAYAFGEIASTIARQIQRDEWLTQCGGEDAADNVCAMLDALSNVADYQRAVLLECLQRLREREGRPLTGQRVLHGLQRSRALWDRQVTSCELVLERRDGQRFLP